MKKIAAVILIVAVCGCSDNNQSAPNSQSTSTTVVPTSSGIAPASNVTPASSAEGASSVSASSGVASVSGVVPTSGMVSASGILPTSSGVSAAVEDSKESPSDSDLRVLKVQKTRFGDVLLVGPDSLPADALMFNGKKVFEDEGMYIGIYGYFQSKESDVILIGSNEGGSATPDTPMSFLIINSASQARVVSDPDFVAFSPSEDLIKTSMDKNGRIFVNLGNRAGKELVAELDSGKLVIHANSKEGVSLANDLCRWLYDNGMESCESELAHKQGCSKYANPAGIFSSVSDMSQLTYIQNQPGYSQSGFNKSCLSWCNGKTVSYEEFRKATCGVR
jgi:hypothetical protein